MPIGFGLLGALLGVIAGGVVVLARTAQFGQLGVHMSSDRIAVYVGVGAAVGFVGGMIIGAELLGLLTRKPPADEPSSTVTPEA